MFAKIRGTLAYQTDGMVIKVDSFNQRDRLGATAKAPRWVIAFKYPAEQMQTRLLAVRWQVGKGGNLTPVADLEPVFIAGSTVRRASLHNIEQIQRLGTNVVNVSAQQSRSVAGRARRDDPEPIGDGVRSRSARAPRPGRRDRRASAGTGNTSLRPVAVSTEALLSRRRFRRERLGRRRVAPRSPDRIDVSRPRARGRGAHVQATRRSQRGLRAARE